MRAKIRLRHYLVELIEQGVTRDVAKLKSVNGELNALHEKYLCYREFLGERSSLEERLRVSLSIVGITPATKDVIGHLGFMQGMVIYDKGKERGNIPLWKVVRDIVRHTEKIRIVDLEAQLEMLDYKITRQAIESAIETHSSTFRISKKGREKYVTLNVNQMGKEWREIALNLLTQFMTEKSIIFSLKPSKS